MKLVQNNTQPHLTKAAMLQQAREFEAAGELKKAESMYEKLVKADPHNETAYNRLMIIHRKQKETTKELATIKKAIHAFEEMYASSAKTVRSKKVSNLSAAFLKATGLLDKKGKPVHLPEPLAKWTRREAIIEQKLKKA